MKEAVTNASQQRRRRSLRKPSRSHAHDATPTSGLAHFASLAESDLVEVTLVGRRRSGRPAGAYCRTA